MSGHNRLAGRTFRSVISALMSATMHTWTAIAAATVVTAGAQLGPAIARADLHNITYVARVAGVAPGSQGTVITRGKQTNMAQLSTVPGNAFEADAVLPDPHQAGMQVSVKRPYSANVHCEIDVDHNVFNQVD